MSDAKHSPTNKRHTTCLFVFCFVFIVKKSTEKTFHLIILKGLQKHSFLKFYTVISVMFSFNYFLPINLVGHTRRDRASDMLAVSDVF